MSHTIVVPSSVPSPSSNSPSQAKSTNDESKSAAATEKDPNNSKNWPCYWRAWESCTETCCFTPFHNDEHSERFWINQLIEFLNSGTVLIVGLIFGVLWIAGIGFIFYYYVWEDDPLSFVSRAGQPAVLCGMIVHMWAYKYFHNFYRESKISCQYSQVYERLPPERKKKVVNFYVKFTSQISLLCLYICLIIYFVAGFLEYAFTRRPSVLVCGIPALMYGYLVGVFLFLLAYSIEYEIKRAQQFRRIIHGAFKCDCLTICAKLKATEKIDIIGKYYENIKNNPNIKTDNNQDQDQDQNHNECSTFHNEDGKSPEFNVALPGIPSTATSKVMVQSSNNRTTNEQLSNGHSAQSQSQPEPQPDRPKYDSEMTLNILIWYYEEMKTFVENRFSTEWGIALGFWAVIVGLVIFFWVIALVRGMQVLTVAQWIFLPLICIVGACILLGMSWVNEEYESLRTAAFEVVANQYKQIPLKSHQSKPIAGIKRKQSIADNDVKSSPPPIIPLKQPPCPLTVEQAIALSQYIESNMISLKILGFAVTQRFMGQYIGAVLAGIATTIYQKLIAA